MNGRAFAQCGQVLVQPKYRWTWIEPSAPGLAQQVAIGASVGGGGEAVGDGAAPTAQPPRMIAAIAAAMASRRERRTASIRCRQGPLTSRPEGHASRRPSPVPGGQVDLRRAC